MSVSFVHSFVHTYDNATQRVTPRITKSPTSSRRAGSRCPASVLARPAACGRDDHTKLSTREFEVGVDIGHGLVDDRDTSILRQVFGERKNLFLLSFEFRGEGGTH